jgi:hypothetical protein
MYGYVKPYKPELKMREWETYHAVYCGLCAELKKRYGFAARFTVNYDFTFLIMLLANSEPNSERVRCPGTLRKRAHCFAGSVSEAAADLSLILAYHKLRDSLNDDGFFKNMFITCPLMLILRSKYKKAVGIHNLFAENSQKNLDELSNLEHNKEKSAEKSADAFGRLLSAAGEYADSDINKRIAKHLLYCVGKIIYILDAYDDLDGDRKHNRYNPLLYSDDLTSLKDELTKLTAEAAADFELMSHNAFSPILENIFYLGLHNTIDHVLNRKRTKND